MWLFTFTVTIPHNPSLTYSCCFGAAIFDLCLVCLAVAYALLQLRWPVFVGSYDCAKADDDNAFAAAAHAIFIGGGRLLDLVALVWLGIANLCYPSFCDRVN